MNTLDILIEILRKVFQISCYGAGILMCICLVFIIMAIIGDSFYSNYIKR